MSFKLISNEVNSYTFFPEATEQDKEAHDRWLDGYTDGSVNGNPDLRYHQSDDSYTLGYVAGLEQWMKNPTNIKIKPICGMCVHYSDREGRCTLLNFPMAEDNAPCTNYEEYCPF